MSKYLGSTCKLSRREGVDLLLKSGLRFIEEKCKINLQPGQHGLKKFKISDYGVRLREKQKIKRMYGILEKQFYNYYKEALRQKGNTGLLLLLFLETRLDNIVYKLGLSSTRAEAKQLINHKFILVNGKICNISSRRIVVGDKVSVNIKNQLSSRIVLALKLSKQKLKIPWLQFDKDFFSGVMIQLPSRDDFPSVIKEQLIVELYSK